MGKWIQNRSELSSDANATAFHRTITIITALFSRQQRDGLLFFFSKRQKRTVVFVPPLSFQGDCPDTNSCSRCDRVHWIRQRQTPQQVRMRLYFDARNFSNRLAGQKDRVLTGIFPFYDVADSSNRCSQTRQSRIKKLCIRFLPGCQQCNFLLL